MLKQFFSLSSYSYRVNGEKTAVFLNISLFEPKKFTVDPAFFYWGQQGGFPKAVIYEQNLLNFCKEGKKQYIH